jgi:glucosamine kinase
MPMLLAIDAGGSSTRAVALDRSGRALGYGRAGGGNPTAVGIQAAATAIGDAAGQALAGVARSAGESVATLALAGQRSPTFLDLVTGRLATTGVSRVVLQPDLLGIFHSGTHELEGYALIAGTGSIAARVAGGQLVHVVGGRGWLLGDKGSGFWIGHQVARAVVAALDGQADPTALTDLVLGAVGIEPPGDAGTDRVRALRELVALVYSRAPVQLADFAPVAFQAHTDPTARAILVEASAALADLMSVLRVAPLTGPIVAGGSVLVRGLLAAPAELQSVLTPPAGATTLIPVADGVVGAAVLALRDAGVEVHDTLFGRLQNEVARVAEAWRPPAAG